MSDTKIFPECITGLPKVVGLPSDDITAYLLQGYDSQSVFIELPARAEIPMHSHGEQWGVVLDGEIELTIGDETKIRRAGDTYHIPAGVDHGGVVKKGCRVLDVFFDPDRYSVE